MDLGHELNRLADGYRGKGYDVAVRPGPEQLPPFARDFQVEIVGRRGAEGVLVAVRRDRGAVAADADLQRYAEVTGAQPGWRLDLAVLEAEKPVSEAEEFSEADITLSLEQAQDLSRLGHARFAVVAAWAALEAAMRMRLRATGQEAGWGTPPRQMLRELFSAGVLSPHEFYHVEGASELRNQIVHGFAVQPAKVGRFEAVVQLLTDVTRRLVSESQPAELTA